ncbi:MAG: TetR/AcrR family transcriptional regulator, partial [Candidatus Hodarchaeales archaeon]
VKRMAESAQEIAENPKIGALEKVRMILRGNNPTFDEGYEVANFIHLPENRELHERINAQTILLFGPVLAKVIEQGQIEGIFSVERPLETVQFLLAGSLFINSTIFNWSKRQVHALTIVTQSITECALGLEQGTFSFLTEPYDNSSKTKNS